MNVNPVGWASSSLRIVARLFSSGVNSTTPVTAISEAPVGVADADIALVAKGTGATLAHVPDGALAGGNKRGIYATDWQKSRTSSTRVASAAYSTIGGGQSNTASGQFSTVAGGDTCTAGGQQSAVCGGSSNNASAAQSAICGGQSNTASNNHSFVGGGQGNTASSAHSLVSGGRSNTAQTNAYPTICGGQNNVASGSHSFVGGGLSNTASALRATVAGGDTNSASGSNSFVGGGVSNTASGTRSVIIGGQNNAADSQYGVVNGGAYGTTRGINGYVVSPASVVPIASVAGITQSALLLLARETTDATATVLTSNTSAASTTNQVILPNNSAYSFSGEVIAGVTAGGDTARWTIDGAIKRGANAASTAMVGTATVTMTHNDAGAATWAVAVTADTTNGGIKVEVTGAAATTIRWVCKINTTEMTY